MNAGEISKHLHSLADPANAAHAQRYFKTGKGEYGEGDRFLGIRVPVLRQQLRRYVEVTLPGIQKLLASPWHEERLLALLLLVHRYGKADAVEQEAIYRLYLDNTRHINNWDLVDSSAHKIVGRHLETRDRNILYRLVRSENLWERRIAIIATFHFIALHQFDDTLKLAELLLDDEADLIHKAVGWALREVGKRDIEAEQAFLRTHLKRMPRTMLRYAIEKFPEKMRRRYLSGDVQETIIRSIK